MDATLYWAARRMGRRIRVDVLGTPRGQVSAAAVAAVLILGWPSLVRLLSAPGPADSFEVALGKLLAAHVALTVAAAGCAVALLVVTFAKKESDDPLLAHPALVPQFLRFQLQVRVLLLAAVYTALLFDLFFASSIRAIGGLTGVAVHLATAVAYLYLTSLVALACIRPWLIGPSRRQRAEWLKIAGVAVMAVGFLAIVLFLDPLANRWPRGVERLAALAGRTGFLLQVPLAVAVAFAQGDYVAIGGWAVALALGLWIGTSVIRRWAEGAITEVLETRSSEAPHYPPLIAAQPGRGLRDLVRLFLLKDHVAPVRGRVPQHVATQVVLVVGGATLLVAARLAVAHGAQSAVAQSLAVAAIASAPLVQSILWALPALGGEGQAIGLLVPVLSPARLFAAKWTSTVAVIAVHALLVAWTLLGVAAALDIPRPGVFEGSLVVLGGALVFGTVGVAFGFALPGSRRTWTSGAGSSRLAQYALVLFGSVAGGWYVLADLARRLGLAAGPDFFLDTLILFGVATALTAVLVAIGLNNLAVMEP